MPTYEYECKNCGYHFEMFQSMKDDPIKDCPECGKTVKRLIGGGLGVIFKGNGFYTTDYKRSSANTTSTSNKDNNKSRSESGTAETKTESGTESKAGAKKESVKV